jgi:prepilin signal peptidase PulO-like enzyme (type II secretory pathway)
MEAALSAAVWLAAWSIFLCVAAMRAGQLRCDVLMRSRSLTIVTLLGGLISAVAGKNAAGPELPSILALACASACAVTDLETGYVFDAVSLLSLGVILSISVALGSAYGSLAGAVLCGGAIASMHLMTRGRGIGLGDAKLAAVIGAGLGGALGASAVGLAFVAGASAAIVGLLRGKLRFHQTIRFAPYLASAAAACVLFEQTSHG